MGLEVALLHLVGDQQERSWEIDDSTSEDMAGSEPGLVGVRPENIHSRVVLDRLKQPQRRGIRVVVKHVGTCAHESECRLAPCCNVIEAIEIYHSGPNLGVYCLGAVNPTLIGCLNGRELDSADKAERSGLAQSSGDHARQIARFLQSKYQRRYIDPGSAAGGHYEYRVWIGSGNSLGKILELEPVGKDQGVALSGITAECLTLLGGRTSLDVTDPESKRIMNFLEPGVRPGIPGCISHRTWSYQPHTKTAVVIGRASSNHHDDSIKAQSVHFTF